MGVFSPLLWVKSCVALLNGCAVRHALSQFGNDESLALLKIDMKNAFNECSRTAFLSCMYEDFPEIFHWMHWCYK